MTTLRVSSRLLIAAPAVLALFAGAAWLALNQGPAPVERAVPETALPPPEAERLPPEVAALLRDARAAPEDVALAKEAGRALIAQARRVVNDAPLTQAAIEVLQAPSGEPDAELLYLEASARQYQHNFDAAFDLLDQALALDPAHINAILTRSTLHLVQGRLGMADADCRRIAALNRPDVAFLCQSTILIATAEAPAAYQRLTDILARPDVLDPALRPWATGLLAEIALAQGDGAAARRYLAQVIAADPQVMRERLMLADLLLRQGEPEAAIAALAPAPATDGVQIRRIIAARLTGDDAFADQAAAALDDRFRVNLAMGLASHAREEATYFLRVADNPAKALERALVNWGVQREIEDARLLIDAAIAAGEPEAARPVADWIVSEGIVVPTLILPPELRDSP